MNIDTARKIDYWVGVPLCFVLSGLNYLFKSISLKKEEIKPVKKIVFIKLSELGAIILSYPLLSRIKKEYPLAELFFVTFNKNRSVFKLLDGIIPDKNILGIREEPAVFILDTLRAIRRLRREEIDIIFDLEFFSRFSAIFAYLVKSKKTAGFYRYTFEGLYRGNLLTHKIQYNPLNHIAISYLSLSQVVKQKEKSKPQLEERIEEKNITFPRYTLDNKAKKRWLDRLSRSGINTEKGRLFLINPGEGMLALREWPLDNFIALARLVLEDKNNYIIIIGTEGANKKASDMLKAINNPRCMNLVNQTELEELLGLFAISEALISNDCGLAHLAMLTHIKKFVILGPENPQVFGPLGDNNWLIYSHWPCSPCLSAFNHRNSNCTDNKCLKVIKPDDVYDVIIKSCYQ